jgi:hypothetical protein
LKSGFNDNKLELNTHRHHSIRQSFSSLFKDKNDAANFSIEISPRMTNDTLVKEVNKEYFNDNKSK